MYMRPWSDPQYTKQKDTQKYKEGEGEEIKI